MLNGVLKHLKLSPITALPDPLLYHRGKTQRPVLDKASVYAWIEVFQRATHHMAAECKAVTDKYERLVNRFGYSLVELTRVAITDTTAPWLVSPV